MCEKRSSAVLSTHSDARWPLVCNPNIYALAAGSKNYQQNFYMYMCRQCVCMHTNGSYTPFVTCVDNLAQFPMRMRSHYFFNCGLHLTCSIGECINETDSVSGQSLLSSSMYAGLGRMGVLCTCLCHSFSFFSCFVL